MRHLNSNNSNVGTLFSASRTKTLNTMIPSAIGCLFVLMLTACSSSSSPPADQGTAQFPSAANDSGPESMIVTGYNDSNADATSPWLVVTDMFRLNSILDATGDGSVRMRQYSGDFPVSRHVEFYTRELDTCEIFNPDAPDGGGGEGGDTEPSPYISGGVNIVINTPSGPWFTYERASVNGGSEYSVDNELPGEVLPAGATLSIPGDEFPTVAAHPLYDPEPPVRLLPDPDLPLSGDSAYSWIPTSGKTRIRAAVLAYDDDNNFIDFVVTCDLRDDGAFDMPADVKEFIANYRNRLYVRYSRVYDRLDFANGIVIRQRNTIAE